jgi:diguanylate cyclase (GGDEF)-like protein
MADVTPSPAARSGTPKRTNWLRNAAPLRYDEDVPPPHTKSDAPERTIVTVMTSRAEPKAPVDPTDACLVVIYGADLGRRIPLGTGAVEAGRSTKCDIPIDQESVSRRHARIAWTGSAYRVKDLGSTNGTYVNDELAGERDLVDGDQIKIGRTILKFMTGGNVEASYHEEIYRLMTYDGLTQIYNKRYFHEALERDIDHFKKKNDQHGHLAGDLVLRELATAVKSRLRREDLFARVGGEEFAVLAPEVPLKGVREAAEKIRRVVESSEFRFEGTLIPTTVSLGCAMLEGPTDTGADLYRRADEALYAAKQGGRNRAV